MSDAILRPRRARGPPARPGRRGSSRCVAVGSAWMEDAPGASPAVSREPGGDRRARAGPAEPRRRDRGHRWHPRIPGRRGRRGRQRVRPDPGAVARRRTGQDLPSGRVRGDPRAARRARAAGRARGTGHRPDRHRGRQRQTVRPGGRRQARRTRRGHRDDRCRRRGAPRRGRAERRRGDGRRRPGPLPDGRRGAAGARAHQPGAAGAPGRRGVQHGRGLSRRDRRLPQPDLRQRLPEPARDRAREGGRAALRREPASAGGVLPRDDPPQRHARRRRPAPGRPPVVQQPARPRCGLSHRPGLHRPDGHDRQAHRPGRAGVARGARRGLPARARDRSGRVLRRHRRA